MTRLDFPAGLTDRSASPTSEALHISCGDCAMAGTTACGDCIVTFLCEGPAARREVELDQEEAQTLALFSQAGMVPALRHRTRPLASVTQLRRRTG